jgi:hypothetical protein
VRAGALSIRTANEGAPSWTHLARTWTILAAAVLGVAVAVRLTIPGWLGDSGERELPDEPLLMLDIFVNNLLLALVPLFGGWLAAGHLIAGRRIVAHVFLVLAAVVVARSLVTIGAVGGADPPWLADAARWWVLEVGALAVGAHMGLWLARHPQLRDEHGPDVIRRALVAIVGALVLAAVVEVLTA